MNTIIGQDIKIFGNGRLDILNFYISTELGGHLAKDRMLCSAWPVTWIEEKNKLITHA